MVDFSVTILGCSSAKPTLRHYTSSQIVTYQGDLYMIDCGEGAQRQLAKFRFHDSHLKNIFISHSHGDHCLGLIGLLSSMSLNGRNNDINIYVPADYERLLKEQIDFFVPQAEFVINIYPIDFTNPSVILSDAYFEVTAIPLHHRVPCYGFLFKEKIGLRHIKPECIKLYNIPYLSIDDIRKGMDFTTADGRVIANEELTIPPSLPRSYAYLSDTRPIVEFTELLRCVDLLYHDATFSTDDDELACCYGHSTAVEAAEFANGCKARRLLLGHFSSRYSNESCLLESATKLFPNSMLAYEGLTIKL